MGNQMSVPLRTEVQEKEPEANAYKVISDNGCVQNGSPVTVSTHVVQHYDEVDLGISISTDNVATSSPKTMEAQAAADASGKNLGKEAKPEAPAARSRFFLTLSRPVPGRPGDQGSDSSAASGRLDVSPGTAPANKDPSEHGALPVAAAPGPAADKTRPGCTEAKQQALPATCPPAPSPPESRAEGPSKPKDFSFFDRLFKLDRGRESTPVDGQPEEAQGVRDQDQGAEAPALPGNPHGVPAGEDIIDSEGKGQEVDNLSYSVPGDPEVLGTKKEDPQEVDTTESSNSIMSFFKTLVSPNKAETKKDPEDTATKADNVCDGHAGQKTLETQAKSKKKRLDSPRLGLTFRKFFRHKETENSPSTSANLKSDKANFTPQEPQGATKSSKGCSPPSHAPPAAANDPREGSKEKSGPTALPLGKLFWKKSVKEDSLSTGAEENAVCEPPVETVRFEEVEPALQTVDLNEEEAQPEPTDVKVKEENKPRRTPLMAFLRQMSVKRDGGITRSEESNGKDSSCQTSNSTEKTLSPPEPEPAPTAQKGKETSSKEKSVDKKSVAETNKQKSSKQEAREAAQCAQQPVVEANSPQSGDKPQKRSEKRRQSLGGFLKGLGPKRMLDAQVQTDPVSIGPVGKSKCTGKCLLSLAKKTWLFQEWS
ncbi:breast carcinoma-amplified sequence 1 isoform X2 [Peromyscus californicus insignis]|uniref:breast carcinoma-amplified sequence 1 isoform X2 n=2 Tax=Peromyscus californicus insignis TaxID=564181 RepID=UPI0022A68422|nr:breast carcinoma-amplified sequence 1 isoform X2 [Peromyscus californicus insignis]